MKNFRPLSNWERHFSSVIEINGDKLKTAPKGFPKEFPDIDLIQFKSYTVVTEVSKSELLKDNFLTQAAKTFKILSPYNQFLNHAINE